MQSKEKHKQNKTTAVHTLTRTPTLHSHTFQWAGLAFTSIMLQIAQVRQDIEPAPRQPRSPLLAPPLRLRAARLWLGHVGFSLTTLPSGPRAESQRPREPTNLPPFPPQIIQACVLLVSCVCVRVWEEAKVFQRQIKLLSELFSLLPLRPTPFASGLSVCQSGRQQGVVNIEICKYAWNTGMFSICKHLPAYPTTTASPLCFLLHLLPYLLCRKLPRSATRNLFVNGILSLCKWGWKMIWKERRKLQFTKDI